MYDTKYRSIAAKTMAIDTKNTLLLQMLAWLRRKLASHSRSGLDAIPNAMARWFDEVFMKEGGNQPPKFKDVPEQWQILLEGFHPV